MATSIATGALKPKVAVGLSAILNLVGAFLSVEVALTVTNAVINLQDQGRRPEARAPRRRRRGGPAHHPRRPRRRHRLEPLHLAARAAVELVARPPRRPRSAPTMRRPRAGRRQVDRRRHQARRRRRQDPPARRYVPGHRHGRRRSRHLAGLPDDEQRDAPSGTGSGASAWGQIGSASLVSLAHGTNDAQKTMGVMTLALIAAGHVDRHRQRSRSGSRSAPPRHRARHLPRRLADHPHARQGPGRHLPRTGHGRREQLGRGHPAPRATSGSRCRPPTWPPARSSARGVGRGAPVRWNIAGRMVAAWAVTLPSRRARRRAHVVRRPTRIGGALGAR